MTALVYGVTMSVRNATDRRVEPGVTLTSRLRPYSLCPVRLAYLVDQYPAISHSFILREVAALRRCGVEVETFSIHRSDPGHLLAESDRSEYARTYAIRPTS